MATIVNEAETLKLIDGTEISVRPLKISLLRDFMKTFEGIADVATDNDKSMNILMKCVQIAMKQYSPEIAGDLKSLEDNIDLPTVYSIIEKASGINMTEALGGNNLPK
jgi:inhibitor of KinA sporulation pathway (predicted exonuclease)